LKDIEALPGLTKIETIDYNWLVSRAEPRDSREQTRLSQLAEKHRSALAESISVVAPESDTERVEKIGAPMSVLRRSIGSFFLVGLRGYPARGAGTGSGSERGAAEFRAIWVSASSLLEARTAARRVPIPVQ
jgi:hypothetical protein